MNYLTAKIADVSDPSFQQLVDELYYCADIRRDDRALPTLFLVLSSITAQDGNALTPAHLPTQGVLTTKVAKVEAGVIYELCKQAAELRHTPIEAFDGKTVLYLLKTIIPKACRAKRPTRNQQRHESMTALILRRRANGDL